MSDKNQKAGLAIAIGILFILGLAGKKTETEPDDDPEPEEPKNPGFGGGFGEEGEKIEPKPEPPLEDLITPEGEWPEPGKFFQVRSKFSDGKGMNLLRIASRALNEAAYKAAVEVGGLTPSEAVSFANQFRDKNTPGGPTRVANFANDIQCESWNDALYTTYGFGDKAQKAPSGRAVRLLPQHAPNLQRLKNVQAPQRRQNYGQKTDQANNKKRSGSGSTHELLYIPGIDLDVLWNQNRVEVGGGTWPDGTTKANPPKWILDLGVKDLTGSIPKGYILRGCPGRPQVKVRVS